MADIVSKIAKGIDTDRIDIDIIKRHGDDIRQRILYDTEVDVTKTAPNVFGYRMAGGSIGLNEISNVDMGYAGTSIDFVGYQLSKRNPYLKELEYNVELMKDSENAIVVLNGGLFSYIPKTQHGKMLSYKDQIAYFYSLFKELANQGKIVAMVRGTEEHRILKNHQVDVLSILQEALGLNQKVCNEALINVELNDDMLGHANVGIRTINWNNTATTGAYIGRKMEERATKRGGADIYLARTTMNYFKTAVVGESEDSKIIKKPIYLISGGSYTPFKGAATAGAEYNSIKDNELPPNSFWYKVTVEENTNAVNGDRPYIVRVNPIQYVAHQIKLQGTDKLVAGIENQIEASTNDLVQGFVDKFSKDVVASREAGRQKIREILIKNRETSAVNTKIDEYLQSKKGKIAEEKLDDSIEDLGSNVPDGQGTIIIAGLDDDMIQE